MTYYFRTKSRGRCGCASCDWHKTDAYPTKKALREAEGRWGRVVEYVHTEEQLATVWGEANARRIQDTARAW